MIALTLTVFVRLFPDRSDITNRNFFHSDNVNDCAHLYPLPKQFVSDVNPTVDLNNENSWEAGVNCELVAVHASNSLHHPDGADVTDYVFELSNDVD